jgi:apolipoprotein N-acyltransferase
MMDKMHPAPFVEGQPPGTNRMIQMGLIPRAAVRKIATASSTDFHLWEEGKTSYVPSICYDLFFSETFRRYPQNIPSISVCSLDESFDGNNVFRSLSYVHTKLRAVEFRQPLVRSSLDGISGAFDLLGGEMKPVKKNDTFTIYRIHPVHIETFYEQHGDWFARLCTLVTLIYLVGSLVIHRRKASFK